MNAPSVVYLIRTHPGIPANETLDAVLMSGVFEQPTTVIWIDDGVWQLVGDSSLQGRKDTRRMIGALTTYDVDQLVASQESVSDRYIPEKDLPRDVDLVDLSTIRRLIHEADIVVSA